MAAMKGVVGIVGLGIMGSAFAKNLVAAGWRVVGYDIDPVRRRAAARAGVEIAKNARDLAGKAATIITSLPKPHALAATVKGIIAAKAPQRLVIETSTFALDDKIEAEKALRRAGHVLLDCPVSGTGAQAKVKDLIIYASGDKRAITRARPVLSAFSRGVYDLGKFGNGSRMKYVANLLVAINNVASAEAMVLGMKAGLDPKLIYDMVTSGAGNSRVFELRAPMMVKNRYDDATMKVKVWQKDMSVIGAFARKMKVPTPLFTATLPVYAAAMRSGLAMQDTAAVCAVLERKAGLRRRKRRG
jgi:3-hydroxyisobutyrate dehydrogenase-like beta-hydroxyacid dehydrogenase